MISDWMNIHIQIIILSLFYLTCSIDHCSINTTFMRFYKIRSCHKSNIPVISRSNFDNVYDCMKFARERRGLAFNYNPLEVSNFTKEYIRYNCQILGCPELGNHSNLVPDINFDYYSAYGNFNSTENATCIKSVGVFSVVNDKKNYTEAIKVCQNLGADLADVLSEIRSHNLANLVKNRLQNWYKAAYVGLDNIESEGKFASVMGFLLSCTKYRAWAPGFPRKNRKYEHCVIIDADRTWRVINCKIELPFICEHFPEMPPVEDVFPGTSSICQNFSIIENQGIEEKRKCLKEKQMSELYKKSSRMDKCALIMI